MNVAAMVANAYARAPGQVRGTVTFIDPVTLAESCGTATANPARGTAADGFKEATAIRQSHLVMWVLPNGLAFAPAPGHRVTWQGETFTVLAAPAVKPAGTVVGYRVTVKR